MKILLQVFVLIFITSVSYSQTVTSEIHPPVPTGNLNDWGTDLLVSNSEPLGRPSAVYRTTNNTIYVAVPDTNITAGRCIVVFASTNNGASWSSIGTVSPAAVIPKVKMVSRPGSDSVYCFFLYGQTVYSWNVITNNLNAFTAYTNIRDFDAAMTSSQTLYLIYDLVTNNDVRWHGSINGGVAWINMLFLTSAGAHPTMNFSSQGDTAVINYKGPIAGTDTLTSAIRNVRYRESAPGTLSIVGSFTTPIAAGTVRDQFMGIRNGTNAWIFYTSGTTGSIDLNCIVSVDGGTNYGAPITIGSLPGRDEYWFDAKPYSNGVDLIFYSDSLQAGVPTNSSDKMYNCFATTGTPAVFSTPVQFSEKPPQWSARGYIPTLVEYFDVGSDAGALWIGVDGANKRVYFDRYSAITSVQNNEIPIKYILSQNYPNPFNPATSIDFSIPNNGLVTLKIYDMTGRELKTLINKEYAAGNYKVSFDASYLSSGVYFYTLSSGSFIDTKKMVLVK